MLLSEIFKGVLNEFDFAQLNSQEVLPYSDISDIVYDSRKAKKGCLFVALTGAFSDGHDYVLSAYEKGARVFLCERKVDLPIDAKVIICENARKVLAQISRNFFRQPDEQLQLIGVTGTKGKTTITHILKTVLDNCDICTGVIGTIGAYYCDKYISTVNTTPESYEIFSILRQMADEGVKVVCMEVSSLGIKHFRVEGLHFNTAIFTNLSPDHIGGKEHNSFEEYAYWKKQLFHNCDFALLNSDDLFSREIEREITCPYETFSLFEKSDYYAFDLSNIRTENFFGVGFSVNAKGEDFQMKVCMPGEYSVLNALSCLAVGAHLGVERKKVVSAMEFAKVKGRAEFISTGASYSVILDYAHNGISMKSLLEAVGKFDHNNIITVFGSVGNRAELRRKEMGIVSGSMASYSIITTDDPNYENPMDIALEIGSYIEKENGRYEIILDRKSAIHKALSMAQKGDIVLILGKGSETCQKIKGEKIPYSDYDSVASYFNLKEG